MYAEQKSSSSSQSTQLIYRQKVLRAFARLKGVTSYSYRLNQVRNAVFYLSPLAMQILQKAQITLTLVNYLAYNICQRVLQISSREYQFFCVIALSAQQSIQKQSPPPSFLAKSTSVATLNQLTRINLYSKYKVNSFYNTNNSSLHIL